MDGWMDGCSTVVYAISVRMDGQRTWNYTLISACSSLPTGTKSLVMFPMCIMQAVFLNTLYFSSWVKAGYSWNSSPIKGQTKWLVIPRWIREHQMLHWQTACPPDHRWKGRWSFLETRTSSPECYRSGSTSPKGNKTFSFWSVLSQKSCGKDRTTTFRSFTSSLIRL